MPTNLTASKIFRSYLGLITDSEKRVVYISIVSESGRVICDCMPFRQDYSVIVDANGELSGAGLL